jgi:sporulation protein YlmC with PRC-barrel domain
MNAQLSSNALVTTDRVNGTPVFDLSGERIGHIDNLSINKTSGQVVYALLSFGGFLGIGERFHPLPWKVLDYDPVREGYVVPLDRAQLKAAPSYTKDDLEAFGGEDQTYRDRIFAYYGPYGAAPYW